jgi:flagellar biogenesis protein FliO
LNLSGLAVLALAAEYPAPVWLANMRLWLGIIGFFVFFLGIAWLLRRVSRHGLAGRAGMRLRVLEQIPVSRDAFVTLLQAGDRVLLIGVTKSGMCLLGDVPGGAGAVSAGAGSEQMPQQMAAWPESPLSGLVSLFKRKPHVPEEPPSHPSFAALLQTIHAEEAADTGRQATDSPRPSSTAAPGPSRHHPASEPAAVGRSGDDRENGQNYDTALRQLDALGRWRSTPSDELDSAIDRMASRTERYGRRGGQQP